MRPYPPLLCPFALKTRNKTTQTRQKRRSTLRRRERAKTAHIPPRASPFIDRSGKNVLYLNTEKEGRENRTHTPSNRTSAPQTLRGGFKKYAYFTFFGQRKYPKRAARFRLLRTFCPLIPRRNLKRKPPQNAHFSRRSVIKSGGQKSDKFAHFRFQAGDDLFFQTRDIRLRDA